jgi:hypothetical protein
MTGIASSISVFPIEVNDVVKDGKITKGTLPKYSGLLIPGTNRIKLNVTDSFHKDGPLKGQTVQELIETIIPLKEKPGQPAAQAQPTMQVGKQLSDAMMNKLNRIGLEEPVIKLMTDEEIDFVRTTLDETELSNFANSMIEKYGEAVADEKVSETEPVTDTKTEKADIERRRQESLSNITSVIIEGDTFYRADIFTEEFDLWAEKRQLEYKIKQYYDAELAALEEQTTLLPTEEQLKTKTEKVVQTKLVGVKIGGEKVKAAGKKVSVGDELSLKIEEGTEESPLTYPGDTREYLYAISVLNKDGEVIGSIPYESEAAELIRRNENRARVSVVALMPLDEDATSITVEIAVPKEEQLVEEEEVKGTLSFKPTLKPTAEETTKRFNDYLSKLLN